MNYHSQELGPPARKVPAQAVGPSHFLRITRQLPVTSEAGMNDSGEPVLFLWVGSLELELFGEEELAVSSGVLLHNEFRAQECLSWPGVKSWEIVQTLLEHFVQSGLLEVLPSTPASD
jgi:hypothetical protein